MAQDDQSEPQKASAAPASPWASAESREQERLAKREAVLRTAARLFNARGYHTTTLDEVASALNVTKPTLYHYFANKDEILFECTRRGLDSILAASAQVAARGGRAEERLREMLIAYALVMMEDFGLCIARTQDHLLSEESRRGFRARKREINEQLRAIIAEGVAEGSLHIGDLRIATFTIAQALNGMGEWYDPGGPMSAREIAERAVGVLMDGLSARAPKG